MPARGERLQKVMAHAGVASRRASEELISAGRVRVNGRVVTELGTRVDPSEDYIEVDGRPIGAAEKRTYYALYKPVGYLSSLADPHAERLAGDLVPEDVRLYPVGRLDQDSEGLMLFTNDGELTLRLTHPRYEHDKEYRVLAVGEITGEKVAQMAQGIVLEDKALPATAQVEILPRHWSWRGQPAPAEGRWLAITLREGHKRQIRLMLDHLDLSAIRLIRVRMGSLELGTLETGSGRYLTDAEIKALRDLVGLTDARD